MIPRRFPARLVFAAWTIPALLSTFETVMFAKVSNRPIEVWRAFASQAPGWYVWALFTPVIAFLAVRYPLTRPFRVRALLAHVAGWLLVASSAALVWAAVSEWLRGSSGSYLASVRNWFLSGLPFTVLGYAAVVGICYMMANRELVRVREQQAALLAQQLSEAQLATLRAQLQPHFLFNSLNGIMALVRDLNTTQAIEALTTLSTMLRTSLQLGTNDEVALAREVSFTRDYLNLERLRFPDRLRVTFDIPPTLLDIAVPAFVLQPFVENAVKHGLMDNRAGITISVIARLSDGLLELSVTDDGAGLAQPVPKVHEGVGLVQSVPKKHDGAGLAQPVPKVHEGVGINNARSRLVGLYGNAASLTVSAGALGVGTAIRIRMPLRHLPVT